MVNTSIYGIWGRELRIRIRSSKNTGSGSDSLEKMEPDPTVKKPDPLEEKKMDPEKKKLYV